MTMKLSTRLSATFAAIAGVLLIVGLANFFSLQSIGEKQIDIVESAPLIDAGMEMKLSVAQDLQMIMELLASRSHEELDSFWQIHEENVERFDVFNNAALKGAETDKGTIYATLDPKLIKMLEQAAEFHNNEFQGNLKIIYSIMKEKLNGKEINQDVLDKADETADAVGEEVMKMLGGVEDGARDVMNAAISESESVAYFARTLSIVGVIGGIILAGVLGFFTTRAIVVPINSISVNLGQAANQVASASEQVASASQQLSEASNEQASSIEETSSSLEQLTGMVNNNVESSEKATELSDNMSKISEQGNESMAALINSMEEILTSNEKIQDLVKVIGEIGEKTAVIDDIVFQTKLLSFNASVEAERAGEHGRGFAVVAQEVGNLAQMSGKAATEISTIVKQSIKEAEAITIENKKKVEGGNSLVKETAKVLKEISQNSGVVSQSANQILSASKDQASGITQINNAVTQLDKATQENASTSEEAASSGEELSAQAETLNALVDDLTQLVTGKRDGARESTYGVASHQKGITPALSTQPQLKQNGVHPVLRKNSNGHHQGIFKHVDTKAVRNLTEKKLSNAPVEAMALAAADDGEWEKL